MAKEITPKVGPNGKQGLTNHDLNQLWLRWAFTHLSSMSYEKLQAHAFAWSYIPFANKYYADDPEAKRRLLTRQSVFYNTEPQTGTIVNGIVASLEENIALGGEVSEDMPNNVKTALMGPLAGIGDSIIQGIIVPILLSIGMSLAAGGSPIGPLFYIITWGIIGPAISFFCFRMGYKLGVGAVDMIVGEAGPVVSRTPSTCWASWSSAPCPPATSSSPRRSTSRWVASSSRCRTPSTAASPASCRLSRSCSPGGCSTRSSTRPRRSSSSSVWSWLSSA